MCRRIKEKMEENNKTKLGQATQHRLTSVAYWRFSVNAALTLLDMVMFCVASSVVISARHEIDIYIPSGSGSPSTCIYTWLFAL